MKQTSRAFEQVLDVSNEVKTCHYLSDAAKAAAACIPLRVRLCGRPNEQALDIIRISC